MSSYHSYGYSYRRAPSGSGSSYSGYSSLSRQNGVFSQRRSTHNVRSSSPELDYQGVLDRAAEIRRKTYRTSVFEEVSESTSDSEDDLIERVKSMIAYSNLERSVKSQVQPRIRYKPTVTTSLTPEPVVGTYLKSETLELEERVRRAEDVHRSLEGELQDEKLKHEDEVEQLECQMAVERAAKTRVLLELSECREKLTEKEQEASSTQASYKQLQDQEEDTKKTVKDLQEQMEALRKAKEETDRNWEEKMKVLHEVLEEERELTRRAEKEKDDTKEEMERMTSDLGQEAKGAVEFVSQLKAKLRDAESLASKNIRLIEEMKSQLDKEKQRTEESVQLVASLQEQIRKEKDEAIKLQRDLQDAKESLSEEVKLRTRYASESQELRQLQQQEAKATEQFNNLLQEIKKKAKKEEESKRKYLKQLEAKTKELQELQKELGRSTSSSDLVATALISDESEKVNEKPIRSCTEGSEDEERYGLTAAKWEKRKSQSLEILATEVSYAKSLQVLNEVFLQPLLQSTILGEEDRKILSRILPIINAAEKNSKAFETLYASDHSPNVAESLLEMAGTFTEEYFPYIIGYDQLRNRIESLVKFTPQFKSFLAEAGKKPQCRGDDMMTFLIKPVQRIPQYSMLLDSLLRNTPPSHPHYDSLTAALDTMAHLGMALNESKRRKEMHDQVEALQQRLQTKGGKEIESLFKIDRQFLNPPSAEVLKQIKVCLGYFDIDIHSDVLIIAKPQEAKKKKGISSKADSTESSTVGDNNKLKEVMRVDTNKIEFTENVSFADFKKMKIPVEIKENQCFSVKLGPKEEPCILVAPKPYTKAQWVRQWKNLEGEKVRQ